MLQLDPFDSLAMTLHHSPGVQAMLVGSGLSRAAGIPTGWEITLDLIRRLATLENVTGEENWAEWYTSRHGKAPSYSEILDAIASTPSERRSILHSYIETSDGEEPRQPTRAHRALAQLIRQGAVRVIISTNFDRLIETALKEVGVEPTVIINDDSLKGATPLDHSRCTLIKLHGDYLDSRIKNTEDELTTYSKQMTRLLDEVFDRYGLIIVGWSGDWDPALRDTMLRTTSRRYPLFWASRGPLTALGQDIVAARDGRAIQIDDADGFFDRLVGTLNALRDASAPPIESVEIAVALAKKYCREPSFGLEWSELVAREIAKVRDFLKFENWPNDSPTPEGINTAVRRALAQTEAIRRICMIGMRWGTVDAKATLVRALASLVDTYDNQSGFTTWVELRKLPATLMLHWALGGAAYINDWGNIGRLVLLPVKIGSEQSEPAAAILPFLAYDLNGWKVLEGLENRRLPHSDFFAEHFEREARDIVVDSAEAPRLFDNVEFILTLEAAHQRQKLVQQGCHFWVPFGRFVYNRKAVAERLDEIERISEGDPLLEGGLLGGSPAYAVKVVADLREFIGSLRTW